MRAMGGGGGEGGGIMPNLFHQKGNQGYKNLAEASRAIERQTEKTTSRGVHGA
jgi:hypothetical protein